MTQIIAALRSAVVPHGGAFSKLDLAALAAPVIQAALDTAQIKVGMVDECIVSNAIGGGGNPARLISLAAGLPDRVAGLSIDRQCAGGLDALLLADQMIRAGMAQVVIAGGVESHSRRPLRFETFIDGRAPQAYDRPRFVPGEDPEMALAADQMALALGISKRQQDLWAIESHAKACAAKLPVNECVKINKTLTDPFARRLTPALCDRAKVICGSVTSANTSVAADGAAFCVVVSDQIARELGCGGIHILGGSSVGDVPNRPGTAPIAAVKSALARTQMQTDQLDVIEVMEAYAAQAIACVQGAGFDPAKVNLGGGSLARGHPIGASGAVNAVRLFHELTARGGGKGLATIAAAGGIATALVLSA